MSFTNPVLIGEVGTSRESTQSVYDVATTAAHARGTRGMLAGGRTFEYVRSDNSTAIGKGKLACYDPMPNTLDVLSIQAAVSAGATSIPVTVVVSIDANELAGSFIGIESSNGLGESYRILSHDSHTTGTLTLEVDRGVVVALTTNSRAAIYFHANAVKISTSVAALAEPAEVAAGVPLVEIPDGSSTAQFAWVQKTGFAIVLFGSAVGSVGDSAYQGEDAGSFQLSTIEIDGNDQDRHNRVSLGTIVSFLPVNAGYHGVMLSIA